MLPLKIAQLVVGAGSLRSSRESLRFLINFYDGLVNVFQESFKLRSNLLDQVLLVARVALVDQK